MLRIDLRNDHRYIRCPSMGTVVGNNRCLTFRIGFLNLLDLILGHINCTEYEIYILAHFFNFQYVSHNKLLHSLRHWCIHLPSVTNGIFIGLTCGTRTCSHSCYFKPWMILQQTDKTLSDHTCCT